MDMGAKQQPGQPHALLALLLRILRLGLVEILLRIAAARGALVPTAALRTIGAITAASVAALVASRAAISPAGAFKRARTRASNTASVNSTGRSRSKIAAIGGTGVWVYRPSQNPNAASDTAASAAPRPHAAFRCTPVRYRRIARSAARASG